MLIMEVVLHLPRTDTGQYWGQGEKGVTQGNGRIPLLAHMVTMKMMMMKVFCMQGRDSAPNIPWDLC